MMIFGIDLSRLSPQTLGTGNFLVMIVLFGLCLFGMTVGVVGFWDFHKKYRARNKAYMALIEKYRHKDKDGQR